MREFSTHGRDIGDHWYRALFDHSLNGILLTDPESGAILAANPEACRLLGRTEDEIRAAGRTGIVDAADPRLPAVLEQRARTGSAHSELTFRRDDGTPFPVDAASSIFAGPDGQVVAGIFFLDISERKRAEAARQVQFEIAEVLSNSDDPAVGLAALLDAVLRLEGIDCGGIYLAGQDGALDLAAHRESSPAFALRVAHFGADTPQARLPRDGRVRCWPHQDRFDAHAAEYLREGLQVLAVIPILHQGRLQAVLNVARHTAGAIPASTLTVLELVAGQIGSAVARLQAAAAVRASQQNLRALFDSLNDFLFVVDPSGHVVQVNNTVLAHLGYTMDELIGEELLRVHPPARRAEVEALLAAMLAGEAEVCQIPLQAKGGVLIPVETRVTLGEWNGQPAIIGVARDITARLQAEAAVRESEARLREVLENSLDASYKRNLQTDAYDYLSPVFTRITGYAADEMSRLPINDVLALIHPDDLPAVEQVLAAAHGSSAGGARELEYRFRHKAGDYCWLLDRFVVAQDADGRPAARIGSVRDISVRKQAEEHVHRLAAIVEHSSDAVVSTDMLGCVVSWNPGAETLYGYTAAEVIGRSLPELVIPHHLDEYRQTLAIVGRGEAVQHIERQAVTKAGRRVDVDVTVSPIKDAAGTVVGVSAIARDVTELKQAREAIDARERKYRNLYNSSPDMYFTGIPEQHLIHECNHTLAHTLGYTREELIGGPSAILFEPATFAHMIELTPKYLARGGYDNLEVRLRCKDGALLDALMSSNLEVDPADGTTYSRVTLHDITERKRMERDLQESEARFRLMADILPVPEVLTRVSDEVILYANPAAAELAGISCAEMIGRKATLFHVDPAKRAAIIEEVLRMGAVRSIEVGYQKQDGSAFWGLYSAAHGAFHGEPVILATMLDISERKKSEQALAQLAAIVDSTEVAVAGLDLNGNVVTWNRGAERLTGYSASEAIGQSISALNVGGSGIDTGEMVHRIRCEERIPPFETTRRTKDGQAIDVSITLSPMCSAAGTLLGISTLAYDITARKRAERALAEHETQLQAIIENTQNAIWSVDSDYRLLAGNTAFSDIAQAQAGRRVIIGESLLDAPFLENSRSFWRSHYDHALAGESFTIQMDSHFRPGASLECHFNPIRDATGAVTGVAARAVDITERVRSEARLRETVQRLSLATTAAGIGVWNWNLADGSLEWDDRVCELFAVRNDERAAGLLHDVWRSRVHPDDLPQVESALNDAIRLGEEWCGDYRIVHPDGIVRYIQGASVVEYDQQGNAYRMVGVNRDITEQKLYEQVLQDANVFLDQRVRERTAELAAALEDVKTANRLKDEFLAAISHELRTPLTGVLGAADILSMQLFGSMTERQQRQLTMIQESGGRLLKMVNALLRYASLVAGRYLPNRERCSLGEVGMACFGKASHAAAAKQVTVEYGVPPQAPVITSDAQGVAEVLNALLDNAIKFTPNGGRIGLEISENDAGVRLMVWDTGIGIEPAKLNTIFMPFVQGDGSLSRVYEGAGLGLAYVARMTEVLGGSISVESEVGKGSRFTVTLPIDPAMPSPGSPG